MVAAIFNAIMDTVSTKYNKTIFAKYFPQYKQFFDGSVSWKNKYKNGDPSQGPKFFGSTTFLVSLTDAWHMAKAFMLLMFSLGIVFYSPVFGFTDFLLYFIGFSVTFEIFYSNIFITK